MPMGWGQCRQHGELAQHHHPQCGQRSYGVDLAHQHATQSSCARALGCKRRPLNDRLGGGRCRCTWQLGRSMVGRHCVCMHKLEAGSCSRTNWSSQWLCRMADWSVWRVRRRARGKFCRAGAEIRRAGRCSDRWCSASLGKCSSANFIGRRRPPTIVEFRA